MATFNREWKELNDESCKNLFSILEESPIHINLKCNNIGSEGCRYIIEFLKKHNSIQTLNLWTNNIRDKGCKYFSEFLKNNNSLNELIIKNNNIGDEGCKYLSEALKINNSLKKLDIGGNNIGVEGCKYLSEALKINSSLQELNLYKTDIRNEGCKYLSVALKTNFSLQKLDLINNDIGVEGCKYLSEALRINNSLISINLEKNSIEDDGCRFLHEGLKLNFSMRELILYNNILDTGTLNLIKKKLEENNSLSRVFLNKPPVNWEEIKKFPNLKVLILEACLNDEDTIPYTEFKDMIVLDLRNNKLSSKFIHHLCEFLKWNKSLQTLNLQQNKDLGDEGGKELLATLSFNFNLIECNLNGTHISEDIQERIKDKLIENYYLTQTIGKTSIHGICLQYYKITQWVVLNQINEVKQSITQHSLELKNFQELLFIFCVWNQIELCEFVFDLNGHNININHTLEDGNTYLHLSVMKDNYEVSMLLIEKGIDVNLKNKEGKTCKDLCLSRGKCKSLFEDIKELKVVILGKAQVGKTTLVKTILQKAGNFARTDGIEIHEWHTGVNKFDTGAKNVRIQLWDFGGQELFYSTHQFFLSKNSIHLLLFNLTDKFMEKEIFFWLNSIQYRAPKSKVIVIGTHMDKIDPRLMKEEMNKISDKIQAIYDNIVRTLSQKSNLMEGNKIEIIPCSYWENPLLEEKYSNNKIWFYPISGKKRWNINYLEEQIRKFSFNTIVRKEFIQLKDKILSIRKEKLENSKYPILLREELNLIILGFFNQRQEEKERNIKLLHELGYILEFGMKYVIIDPQWLAYVFKSVISLHTSNQIKDGMIDKKHIFSNLQRNLKFKEEVLSNVIDISTTSLGMQENKINPLEFSLHDIQTLSFLIDLMERFDIIIPVKANDIQEPRMLIPSLLETKKPKEIELIFNSSNLGANTKIDNSEILGRKYTFPFIPRGIFENIFAKVFPFIGSNIHFWKNGFYIIANQDRGCLMFEIKLPEHQNIHNTPKFDHLYKGSVIEIKSTGHLNHYLISAFHFCIKELFERNFPLLWENVKIELEYNFEEAKYNISLQNCLELWKKENQNEKQEVKALNTPNNFLIPWEKLIPEESDRKENNIPIVDDSNINFNKFVPFNKIGEGKYGCVYKCRSIEDPNQYVVKFFKITEGDLVMNENEKRKSTIKRNETRESIIKRNKIAQSFQNELELMKELKHPNVTKLIGHNQTGDRWLLVFPFYDVSLEDLNERMYKKVRQPKRLPKCPLEDPVPEEYWWKMDQILFMYQEILKGLEYLHLKMIAHLDLKAANILINLNSTDSFDIKSIHIHDFGIAKKCSSKITNYGGSPNHMAPEIKLCDPIYLEKEKREAVPYDPFKADIYSFGILLYEIVANTSNLYRNSLKKLNGHKFEQVILGCLKEAPNQRFDMKDLRSFNLNDPNQN